MSNEKLIHMANQIAVFFRSYPEDQATSGIKDHLKAFWTPKMQAKLLACADQSGNGLDPLIAKALCTPQEAVSPINKETAGPEEVGQLGSDAG